MRNKCENKKIVAGCRQVANRRQVADFHHLADRRVETNRNFLYVMMHSAQFPQLISAMSI